MAEADQVLRARGFLVTGDGVWVNDHYDVGDYDLRLTIKIGSDFPWVLPEILVERSELPRRLAHVERTGKLCLVPSSGSLVDVDRPGAIVSDLLERAASLLSDTSEATAQRELLREFRAYWETGTSLRLLSTLAVDDRARVVEMFLGNGSERYQGAVTDGRSGTDRWIEVLGLTLKSQEGAFYLPLVQSILPPDFDEGLRLREVWDQIQAASKEDDFQAARTWLLEAGLPATFLLSMPAADEDGRLLTGFTVPKLGKIERRESRRGYPPSRVPPERALSFALKHPVLRLAVDRADSQFLLARAGGVSDLAQKKAVVIGCGSVGSLVADAMAQLGFSQLALVDDDRLETVNTHRHLAGARGVGRMKVEVVAECLEERFPGLSVKQVPARVERALAENLALFTEADVVVVATGEETTERALNRVLGLRVPRVHVWLEPLGLGGHVLSIGPQEGQGCYECLFERDREQLLFNAASLARPNQEFQRSLAGCAGTFTPFGCLDAREAAAKAAREARWLVLDSTARSRLTSWMVEPDDFAGLGFELSERGLTFAPRAERRIEGFGKAWCQVCSGTANA